MSGDLSVNNCDKHYNQYFYILKSEKVIKQKLLLISSNMDKPFGLGGYKELTGVESSKFNDFF